MPADLAMDRRTFLRMGAGGGAALVLGIRLPGGSVLHAAELARAELAPAAWLRIDTAGLVQVVVDEAELGQGPTTALPMMVAEELDVPWEQVRWLPVPEDPSSWVRTISTGGSTSVRQGWEPLRRAGAAAREMLRQAAAERWGVPVAECRAEAGTIVHGGSDRRAPIGELVEAASALPVPEDPPFKDAADYRLVGTSPPRVDLPPKVRGEPVFGSDVALPGMLVASVERPPAYGARLLGFRDADARAVEGVVDVFEVPQGVAVVARDTWAALRGRLALQVDWDEAASAGVSSARLYEELGALAETPGRVLREAGDAEATLSAAAQVVEAEYRCPYLDHAPMEPMIATAWVHDGQVEVWVPTQAPTAAQRAAARVAGMEPGAVRLHATWAGGGFGRRLATDDTELAVAVAMRVSAPVQVVWTREDSLRNGTYRPLTLHRLRGGLDAAGNLVAWTHRATGVGTRGEVASGAESPPYEIPNFRADVHLLETPVPTGPWRSVSYTHMGFVVESFVDELAAAAGADPLAFRLARMRDPKLRAALELAAEKAGWGTPLPEGRFRGLAAVSSFGSHAAEVAEVSVSPRGEVRVHRVVVGVHCGRVVHPDALAAQIDGAVALALGFTLKHEITLVDGVVQESNFRNYPLVTLGEMPVVEVYPVPTDDAPTGIGEPPVPPLPAAVANAVFAATGRRVRHLPIRAADLVG